MTHDIWTHFFKNTLALSSIIFIYNIDNKYGDTNCNYLPTERDKIIINVLFLCQSKTNISNICFARVLLSIKRPGMNPTLWWSQGLMIRFTWLWCLLSPLIAVIVNYIKVAEDQCSAGAICLIIILNYHFRDPWPTLTQSNLQYLSSGYILVWTNPPYFVFSRELVGLLSYPEIVCRKEILL